MRRVLLDTHVLIWAVAAPERLTADAAGAVEGADQLYISSITGWEIMMLHRKGRVVLSDDPQQWLADAVARLGLVALPVTLDVATASAALDCDWGDPADRLILATALAHELPLVTADRNMRGWARVETIW